MSLSKAATDLFEFIQQLDLSLFMQGKPVPPRNKKIQQLKDELQVHRKQIGWVPSETEYTATSQTPTTEETSDVADDVQHVEERIRVLGSDEEVLSLAKKFIRTEHDELPDAHKIPGFDWIGFLDQVEMVRAAQARIENKAFITARDASHFKIKYITGVESNGNATDIEDLYLLKDLDWRQVKSKLLTETLTGRRMLVYRREPGTWHEDKPPCADGEWQYQVSRNNIPEQTIYPLNSAQDYTAMRHLLATEYGADAVVWYKPMMDFSQKARAEWAAIMAEEAASDDLATANGWTHFDPSKDPTFDWDLEYDFGFAVKPATGKYAREEEAASAGASAKRKAAGSGPNGGEAKRSKPQTRSDSRANALG